MVLLSGTLMLTLWGSLWVCACKRFTGELAEYTEQRGRKKMLLIQCQGRQAKTYAAHIAMCCDSTAVDAGPQILLQRSASQASRQRRCFRCCSM